MTTPAELPTLPFERHGVVGVAPLMRALQEQRPVTRVRTPAGDDAWLVTRHAHVKQLYGDPRLGRSHPDPERAARITDSVLLGGPTGNHETEPADHARMRALLTPMFSARRMRALQPRIEVLVDSLLDALAARTPPADLHEALSVPLPVLVICELLGVPVEDRVQFRAWSQDMGYLHDRRRSSAALGDLTGYMHQLVARKRAHPAEDVISSLCAAHGGGIPDEYVAELAAMLLFAGHETTVVQIDLGTVLLLVNPDQREKLAGDPSLLASAVEEMLRASLGGGGGLPRYAREDIEIDGVTIHAGEAVLLHIGAANHDQHAFADPDHLDISRHPNPHLSFGHGPWYCIGAPLARIELHAAFSRLVARFPTLRLATSVDQLRVRTDLLTGGLAELPVTW